MIKARQLEYGTQLGKRRLVKVEDGKISLIMLQNIAIEIVRRVKYKSQYRQRNVDATMWSQVPGYCQPAP